VTPPPSLSVVIPSYRRTDLLTACLESVVRFAPPAAEIIVVDDGSADGIVSATVRRFPDVRVVRRPKPGGFCAAANAGIRAATGDIVELLNDDAEVAANWTVALRHFSNPNVVAVAPLVLIHGSDPPRIDSAGDEYDPGGFARKRGHGQSPANFPTAGTVWGVSAAAGFYRRSTLLAVGGFPEEFGAYFDDVVVSFRLRHAGYTMRYEPASVVRHHVSASYGRRPARRVIEQQSRNEEWVYWRHVRGRHLVRHAAVVAGKAVRRWQEGNLVPWLTGRCRGWAAACGWAGA
jgi:GT2 family glycosyltransferase